MREVPLEVTDEASAYIAHLGMQQEFARMLDWVHQNVPELQGIRVTLRTPWLDRQQQPYVHLSAYRAPPVEGAPLVLSECEWGCWVAQTFPRHVRTSFLLLCTFQPWLRQSA